MRRLHLARGICVLCETGYDLGLHHVLPRSQGGDDVEENLVFLCGSGTTGCHGLVEMRNPVSRGRLGDYVWVHRPDTIAYLVRKFGTRGKAHAWLDSNYPSEQSGSVPDVSQHGADLPDPGVEGRPRGGPAARR